MLSAFYQWSLLLNIAVLLSHGKINSANFFLVSICILTAQVHSLTSITSREQLQIHQREPDSLQVSVPVKMKTPILVATLNEKHNTPAIIKLPLISGSNTITEQENNKRIKKSVPKQEKQVPGKEMRKKLKQLMANITETLNDMDWYFGLDQLENPVTSNAKKKLQKKTNRKIDNSNIDTSENEVTNDLLLDLFIKQIYDINPIVFEKLRNRINDRSSLKRQARLAQLSQNEIENERKLYPDFQNTMDKPRKCILKKVLLRKMVPDYGENEFEQDAIDTPPQTSIEEDKQKAATLKEIKNIPTSTPSTTFETFYDYGDYYKNHDYNAPDILEYDINRVEVERSTIENHENVANGYRRKNFMKFYPRKKY